MNPPPITSLRLLLRLANSLSLDLLALYRGERNFTDAVILAALTPAAFQSNRFGADGAPRGLSVNAVSTSLGLPFETVRRHVKRLVTDGICETTREGVRLSDAFLASPAHAERRQAAYGAVREFYHRIKQAGCIALLDLAPTPPEAADDATARDVAWRASCEYFLRIMEILLPGFDSLTQAFVIMEVVRTNTEGLPDEMRGGETHDQDGPVADTYRHPAKSAAIGARLGLPHETTRRNLLLLVEDGRMIRTNGGFIVPAAVLARPKMAMGVAANFRNLNRFFAELAQARVLARWDETNEAAPLAC